MSIAKVNIGINVDTAGVTAGVNSAIKGMGLIVNASDETSKRISKNKAAEAAFIKRIEGMNALEQDKAIRARDAADRRMGMTKKQIERDIARETRREKMRGMNALEREDYIAGERTRKRRMGMSSSAIAGELERERRAAVSKQKWQAWGDKSLIEKTKYAIQGAADMRAIAQTVAMPIAGIGHGVASVISLGGELETMTARFAFLTGDADKANDAIERLRDLSTESGAPLRELGAAYASLVANGTSSATSLSLADSIVNAAELMGGDLAGNVATLTNAIVGLGRSAVATESSLEGIASTGLDVYGALAERLSTITGRAVSAEEALAAVRRGSVLGGTAISAIADAANSEKAKTANNAMANSFEGQIARLKTTAIESFREIGKFVLGSMPITELIAGIKGAFSVVRDILREIGRAFAAMVGADRAKGIEGAFIAGRDIAFTIAETLVNAGFAVARTLLGVAQTFARVTNINAANINDHLANGMAKVMRDLGYASDDLVNITQSEVDKHGPMASLNPNNLAKTQTNVLTAFARARDARNGAGAKSFEENKFASVAEQLGRVGLDNPILAALRMANPKGFTELDDQQFATLEKTMKGLGMAISPTRGAVLDLAGKFKIGTIDAKQFAEELGKLNRDIELTVNSVRQYSTSTMNELAMPLEQFHTSMQSIEDILAQASTAILELTAEDKQLLADATTRRAAQSLQNLIGQNIGTDTAISSAITRGSSAAAEAEVRARYGDQGMSTQEKIRLAVERAKDLQEQQLKYQEELVAEARRQGLMKPAAIVAMPKGG